MPKTTMYLRGVRQEIAREAKALAAREGVTLAALVERALERETRRHTPGTGRLSEIAREMDWYEANEDELLERYRGRVLAIVGGEVVDHDQDAQALAARVAERYGARSVYMPRCERIPRTADVRSPEVAG